MSVVLNSDDLPVDERVDAIHEAICAGVLPVEIRWDRPADQIDLRCRLATAGPLNFNTARSSDNALWRTARQATIGPRARGVRRGAGCRELAHLAGRTADGAPSRRRDDLRDDQDLLDHQPGTHRAALLPGAALRPRPPARALDQVLGARIGPDNNPLAAVVAPFLASLGRGDVLDRPRAAELVVTPALELVRALVAAHVEDDDLAREPLDQSLALRVQRYVAAHLGSRDLNAETIAAAHHVSVRQLYKVLARADIRLTDTIRRQRLEACRRELRDDRRRHVAIATISARWGFADPSHFSRVFRAEYGMTPLEWRTGPG